MPQRITLSLLHFRTKPDEGKHQSRRIFSSDSCAASSATRMAALRNTSITLVSYKPRVPHHGLSPGRDFQFSTCHFLILRGVARLAFTMRIERYTCSLHFKGSLVDPRLRASNEHILIVRVPRAGGRPGYPSNPSEAARCASIRIDQAGL